MKNFYRIFILFALLFTICSLLIGCDELDESFLSDHEHILVEHKGRDATCDEYGWLPYNTCSICTYSTYTVVEALGHDYSTDFVDAGEVDERSCTRCDSKVTTAHVWSAPVVTDSTCTTEGSRLYTCYSCGAKKTEIISMLGHDYTEALLPGGKQGFACSRCSSTVSIHDHDWQTLGLSIEPTCTAEGKAELICKVCSAKSEAPVSILGHDYTETILPDGKQGFACSRCSTTVSVHTHDWQSLGLSVEPTCTAEGKAELTCSICSAKSETAIPALGHDYLETLLPDGKQGFACSRCSSTVSVHVHDWQTLNVTVVSTCTTEGKAELTCSICSAKSETTIPALGHDYSETLLPDGQQGFECSRCSSTVSVHVHDWQTLSVILEPTCTKEGKAEVGCTICSAKSESTISILGHDYSETLFPDGKQGVECLRCSATVTVHTHDWQILAVVSEPTCTVEGAARLICSLCSAKGEVTMPALGHDYSETLLPDGQQGFACSRCSTTVSVHTHEWKSSAIIEPSTCTSEGKQELICSVCSTKTVATLPTIDHVPADRCVSNGEDHSIVCADCSTVLLIHPHSWISTGVVTPSTCTTEGTEGLLCSGCDAVTTSLLPLAPHEFGDEYKLNGDVHSIFCKNCSATVGDHPHVWESFEVVKEAGCDGPGTEIFICTVCHAEKTVTTPETHPAYGWVTLTAATAFTEGEKVRVCMECHKQFETERIAPDVESMPRIYLEGNYTAATAAKNEVSMTVEYIDSDRGSFTSYATIKVQGSSSTAYDKKNYTIKFFKDADHESKYKVDFGWGKESKYVMKANWVDFSQSRNVMSCRLWGDIVATRATSANQQKLASLKTNGGAVDGYPIAVYMNGNFHGIYTMNVPKDEWMFGMGEKDANGNKPTTEALIASDDWNHTDFYSTIGSFVEDSAGDLIAKDGGWELRYYGGDDHQWVAVSFDALITFCQNNDGEAFRNGIREYLDVDAAIDYIIYMYANCMHDNASKNMLWATYDGKTWIPSVYDQDGTFGQVWDGVRVSAPNSSLPSVKNGRIDVGINYGPSTGNTPKFILWDRMWNSFTGEIIARYDQLRASVLSTEYMIAEYKKFEALIPESMFEADLERWQTSRDTWWAGKGKTTPYDYTAYHYDYIYDWIKDRMYYLDNTMNNIRSYYGL